MAISMAKKEKFGAMKVQGFVLGPLATNAYLLVHTSSRRACVIDPGADPQPLLAEIQTQALAVEAILLTHAHFDHIAGLEAVRKATGAPVYVHTAEALWLTDPVKNGAARWEQATDLCRPAEYTLSGDQILRLLGRKLHVWSTPGHSPGGVTYQVEQLAFCGDLLFAGSVGRTDLYGSDPQLLAHSLLRCRKIFRPQAQLFPGHGPATTWEKELQSNPWLQGGGDLHAPSEV